MKTNSPLPMSVLSNFRTDQGRVMPSTKIDWQRLEQQLVVCLLISLGELYSVLFSILKPITVHDNDSKNN